MPSPGDECSSCKQYKAELELLRKQLEESQAKCSEAEHLAERQQETIKSLEREMEEMHDNFKEDECEQFEQVKQELDIAIKNCKILQIRLNKSERQYAQLEQVKRLLERQLEERIAETTSSFEGNSANYSRQQQQQQSVNSFVQLSSDCVKVSSREFDQLLRDLNDLSERERDLQEQIKHSEGEAQLKSDRLQSIEAENEILLGRINKLTIANSRLRSLSTSSSVLMNKEEIPANSSNSKKSKEDEDDETLDTRQVYEQNQQLKLMLELSQSDCQRLKAKLQSAVKTSEEALSSLKQQSSRQQQESSGNRLENENATQQLELECRKLRARLVGSERELRQLRAQLEFSSISSTSADARPVRSLRPQLSADSATSPPASAAGGCSSTSRCAQTIAQLENQNRSLRAANERLSSATAAAAHKNATGAGGQQQPTQMESDLLERLKQQLETSENELAKARSRLVELDLDCGRAQRQYKRLLSSLETCGTGGELRQLGRRRSKLPPEQMRDAMNRQELREALRDLESDLDEMFAIIQSKECLIKELSHNSNKATATGSESSGKQPEEDRDKVGGLHTNTNADEQIKSLRRLLEQERLLSNNLKLDVSNLEQLNLELQTSKRILERERVAMEEELDKLRQLTSEMLAELEESQREKQEVQTKNIDLIESIEKLRLELTQAKRQEAAAIKREQSQSPTTPTEDELATQKLKNNNDLLLMARDLSELKVKNGFLMRQLEISREEASKQLEELRQIGEAQTKRAVEMAQLELRERHLTEVEQLRDESSDLKQKLAMLQRQISRQEEEVNLEKERARAFERDWRRDRSQWQQLREQLDGQLQLEKRSSEFKLKELEASVREKERALISVQDKCVQLERDFKRLQNKHKLLEEDSVSRIKRLSHDLEVKSKELIELRNEEKTREQSSYEQCRRLTNEKVTLSETLEAIRRSYDDKLVELKRVKEISQKRQEQSFKERTSLIEQIDLLNVRINNLSEFESQSKLLRQRVDALERQLEYARRELMQIRDERNKLKTRCEELEKRERISKTSQISGGSTTTPFLKSTAFGRAFGSTSSSSAQTKEQTNTSDQLAQPANETVERLSGKINDQRHLINVLRQQLDDTQLELKQLKLLQSSTRSKWQAQVALVQSRLNQCEERLAFETSLMADFDQQTVNITRGKFDSTYASERSSANELIQQQQAQIELLSRDLKKVSQAHDMLRLHNKQLDLHCNKLSKKLIEYQQQQATMPLQIGAGGGAVSRKEQQRKSAAEEEADLIRKEYTQLSNEMKPLMLILNKIVGSLDASVEQPQQPADSSRNSSPSDSTNRPLRTPAFATSEGTGGSLIVGGELQQQSVSMPAARPAHHVAINQPSRLVRMIAGSPTATSTSQRLSESDPTRPKKLLRKTRVKCSSLGITPSEKKQLKQHLQKLEDLVLDGSPKVNCTSNSRFSSTGATPSTERLMPTNSNLAQRQRTSSHSNPQASSSVSGGGFDELDQHSHTSSRVRWQLDSDAESERSWSAEPTARAANDKYRRFPQAGPGGASLTDYESESSLASDFSFSGATTRVGRSGAESDSGLANSTATASKLKKRTGLKGRLTNTLRSISRSITAGFGSDSEISADSAAAGYESSPAMRRSRQQQVENKANNSNSERSSTVREIRV